MNVLIAFIISLRAPMRRLVSWLCVTVLLCASGAATASKELSEGDAKALFVIRLIDKIEWPSPQAKKEIQHFKICIIGSDSFSESVNMLKKLSEAQLQKNRVTYATSVEEYKNLKQLPDNCHVLLISNDQESELDTILERIKQKPTLTISDIPNFTAKGGMVAFLLAEETASPRYTFNLPALRTANLSVDPDLLELDCKKTGGCS